MESVVRRGWVLAVAVVVGSQAASGESYEVVRGDDYELAASTRSGLRLEVDDPELELRLGGQFNWDAAWFAADGTPIPADNEIRRARIYLEGDLLDDWSFKIEREFAPGREGWRNLWIGYQPTRSLVFRAGNFVTPFGLEEVSSSSQSTFLERALPSAIAPSYQTGLGIRTRGRFGREGPDRWTWVTAGYVESLGKPEEDPHQSEHWGVASRFTFTPLAERRRLVHLGVSVDYERPKGDSRYGISSRPESALAPTLLNTGSLQDVDDVISVGAEAATVLGPFSAQGEYMRSTVRRSGQDGDGNARSDAAFDGWYVQASYVLTGEQRRYSASTGTFQGVKPKRRWGALEVAVRYSTLDLNDNSVSGGDAKDWTVGLNWYLRENVRLMFNYIRVDALNNDLQHDDPQIFSLRTLVAF